MCCSQHILIKMLDMCILFSIFHNVLIDEIRVTTVPPIGSYSLTVTVTDPCGNLNTSTPTITVINRVRYIITIYIYVSHITTYML